LDEGLLHQGEKDHLPVGEECGAGSVSSSCLICCDSMAAKTCNGLAAREIA